ncbi:unnamed protein product [Ilex paraguariensis]
MLDMSILVEALKLSLSDEFDRSKEDEVVVTFDRTPAISTPYLLDGQHTSKEKNGRRGGNQGRGRRDKHCGFNEKNMLASYFIYFWFDSFLKDLLASLNELIILFLTLTILVPETVSSWRHMDVSKPPLAPTPRMPDGTRGFTMGRVWPLDSNQS